MSLVIVLGSLVLLSALVVAFLVQMSTELRSSKLYADGASSRILFQSAANIVQAQIRDATRGIDSQGNPLAWASQPGMIRTYDSSGRSHGFFKLYSDESMAGAGSFNAATAIEQLANWQSNRALFTDLNQPIDDNYPILDGSPKRLHKLPGISGVTYDTNTDGKQDIDGFRIDADKTPSVSTSLAPMPVKWLYVLENGEVVAATAGSAPNSVIVPGADVHRIVGRVAFWTDDESCKLNINTASEGVYWDTPRSKNSVEDSYKSRQPVRGEYQRYPGHPAMTCLSTVLKRPSSVTLDSDWSKTIYNIVPRIKTGGSNAGTTRTAWSPTTAPVNIDPDADRLFATVDELLYKQAEVDGSRVWNNLDSLNKGSLERSRFFLTACSRAPDVNLFNQPRVCNWPVSVHEDVRYRSPYDSLIAFCTTMRRDLGAEAHRYYFQRKNPNSATEDLPAQSSPRGLDRNRMLLDYLRDLTSRPVPGFGGSFQAKYGRDNEQILVQMFDYIRGATNLNDTSLAGDFRYTTGVKGTAPATPWANSMGLGQVVPIESASQDDSSVKLRGFGRFRTIQGASFLFIGRADGDVPSSQPAAPATPVPAGHIRVQAMFIPQFFDPAVGVVFNKSNFKWKVDLSQMKWGPASISMGFPSSATVYTQNRKPYEESAYGDQFGVNQTSRPQSITLDLPKSGGLGFSGGDVTLSIMAPDSTVVQKVVLYFSPGPFPLPTLAPTVYDVDSFGTNHGSYNYRTFAGREASMSTKNAAAWFLDTDVVRSVGVKSGDTRLIAARVEPPKTLFAENAQYADGNSVLGAHNFFDGFGRPYYGAALGRLVPGLTYQSYPTSGSYKGIFRGNKAWLSPTAPPWTADCFGIYPGNYSSASDIPFDGVAVGKDSGAIASGEVPGDWDNAPFDVRDGPYINKPDEGDIGFAGNTSIEPYSWKIQGESWGGMSSSLFTPNRQIPSAVMFGSLPTGIWRNRPWQTLLFHPKPGHPGNKDLTGDGMPSPGMPADHLYLDLFHMPVVEPYAISEPLSTAGRINMNYEIVPFSYIKRDTGIRAILKAEKVIAIRDTEAIRYKQNDLTNPPQANIRLNINIEETLKGFAKRFEEEGDLFRSATEICELPIVPMSDPPPAVQDPNATYEKIHEFWKNYRLTGDNSRERIYATLYPRLTTKSNTFTIHIRAQSLKQAQPGNIWTEGRDQVTGEYRGSQTIERFVDPNYAGNSADVSDPPLPDYAEPGDPEPISRFYNFRVLTSKQFAP